MIGAPEIREPEVQKEPKARLPQIVPRPAPSSQPTLFASSLLEYQGFEKRRRRGATFISFIIQCLFIALALVIPLMFTEALPQQQLLTFLVAPPPPPPPPPPAAAPVVKTVRQIQSDVLSSGQLRTPSRIPQKVAQIHEEAAPPPIPAAGGVIGGVPGGIPGGQLGGVIGGIVSSTSSLQGIPRLAPAVPKVLRVSQGVTQGLLIHKVDPIYPLLARSARIQGDVVLAALISKDGEIQNLTLVSGHPLLAPAAIDAVRQWRYRPYLLNGEPVEVETTVTVLFQLSN